MSHSNRSVAEFQLVWNYVLDTISKFTYMGAYANADENVLFTHTDNEGQSYEPRSPRRVSTSLGTLEGVM